MTICSPSTCNITLGLRPRAVLPASGEQIVMLPSHKGNNCIMLNVIKFPSIMSTNSSWGSPCIKGSDFYPAFKIFRSIFCIVFQRFLLTWYLVLENEMYNSGRGKLLFS